MLIIPSQQRWRGYSNAAVRVWLGEWVGECERVSVALLVNTIQTEPFQLGPSNLVHLLLTTRGRHLLIFKVKGQGHTLQILVKPCKHDTDLTLPARTVKLGTHTSYDKRVSPIGFQGQRLKVKVTRYTLLLNLVNTIQTEPFQLRPSNMVHILLMTGRQYLFVFKVRGQRSRSHVRHCFQTFLTR